MSLNEWVSGFLEWVSGFLVELGSIGHWARNVFNVPGMVPAAAITYGALLTETQMAVAVSNYEWSRRRND